MARWAIGPWRRERWWHLAAGPVAGQPVRVIKPLTYVNRSGAVLAPLRVSASADPATELLVLVDEAQLPAGRFRLRGAGSAGGHNGLKSIEAAVGGREYPRLRIGVGPIPPELDALSEFVLDRPSRADREAILEQFDAMAGAVECWVAEGIEAAMNRFNR